MSQDKPPFYLATGLLLGLGLGVLISVLLFPARMGEGSPSLLSSENKTTYRGMVAQAFAVDNNLERASARLTLLGEEDQGQELAAEAQRMLAEGKPLADAEILARLASALQRLNAPGSTQEAVGTGIPLFTPDPASATQTALPEEGAAPTPAETIPLPVKTSQPTPSPAPTLGAPFELRDRLVICDPEKEPGLIEIQVEDQGGSPVPGVKIDISWLDGQEYFFTGLIQSVSPGFADFTMTAGAEYSLRVGEGGEQVRGVGIPECNNEDGSKYYGSVYLRFTQP
ncbi:MAG: hypothetical protein AB9891_08155 [Anaerolineaceae bacterium]